MSIEEGPFYYGSNNKYKDIRMYQFSPDDIFKYSVVGVCAVLVIGFIFGLGFCMGVDVGRAESYKEMIQAGTLISAPVKSSMEE